MDREHYIKSFLNPSGHVEITTETTHLLFLTSETLP